MEIVLISYGDIRFDGRLRSLIRVFSEIGNVHSLTRGSEPLNAISKVCNVSYMKFIGEAVRYAKEIGKIDWLVLDNRKATIPGMIIQRRFKPSVTIQDSRELYLIKEVNHFAGKIGCIFEKIMVRKADIVICANKERAQIMQKEHVLIREPLTYENLRQLQYGSDVEITAAKKKLDPYIHEGEYRIISSSACSIKRNNDVLVKNLTKVNKPCRLFLVGESTFEEEKVIRTIIAENKITNVEILGRLSQTELKYLISKSHIGIVNYGQYDSNNKFCASGKLYEFIYEGIPVVTTSNPPLLRLCNEYKIGIADDEFHEGIDTILSNYEYFSKHVSCFTKDNTVFDNDRKLIYSINELIKIMNCEK